jgi:molybdopterin-guanine dinucleotide biosynthesis protein A
LAGNRLAAVVLAGGRAQRLGGADKPLIEVGGRTLACAVISAAVEAGAERVVMVGPDRRDLTAELARFRLADLVELTSEQPPGGGPVPGLRAGLERAGLERAGLERAGGGADGGGEDFVLLLAADLPFLTGELLGGLALAAAGTGAVAVDETGRPQWLTSCWPVAVLRAALARYEGDSLRGLLAPLEPRLVMRTAEPGQPPFWLDCDSPEDVVAARRWVGDDRPRSEF